MYSYVTLDAFKAVGSITGTSDDTERRRVLESVTRQIDAYCRRTFRNYLATYYFSPSSAKSVLLDTEELGLCLLSVTTLKTDAAGDRTYEVTWAATDYDLLPLNALNRQRPYYEISIAPNGTQSFPSIQKSVEIVGKWGFYEDLARNATLLDAAISDITATAIIIDASTTLEVLQTILIDDEQMYITGISGVTLTVERGVNGTTAATHDDDSVIDVYRYPWEVTEAVKMQTARLWTRRSSGFANEVGFADTGSMRPWIGLGFDEQETLAEYRLRHA